MRVFKTKLTKPHDRSVTLESFSFNSIRCRIERSLIKKRKEIPLSVVFSWYLSGIRRGSLPFNDTLDFHQRKSVRPPILKNLRLELSTTDLIPPILIYET